MKTLKPTKTPIKAAYIINIGGEMICIIATNYDDLIRKANALNRGPWKVYDNCCYDIFE